MSDWGKGATNNDIGWGQGANNEIGWGAIHALSYSGDTDIVGAAVQPPQFLLDFAKIATDFTFTRSSFATRVNEQGLIETVTDLGSELVQNGSFSSGSSWSFSNTGGSFGWNITDGRAICDATGVLNGRNLQQTLPTTLIAGQTYRLSLDILQSVDAMQISLGGVFQFSLPIGTNLGYSIDFIPTTTSNFLTIFGGTSDLQEIDNISVKEVLEDDVPRIDYTNGEAEFLLEPQSTNLITYSEDFSQWFPNGSTLNLVSGVAPNGSTSVYELTSVTQGKLQSGISGLSVNTEYTLSFYVKQSSPTTLVQSRILSLTGGSGGSNLTQVNYQDQLVTDEWVRITHTFTTDDTLGNYVVFVSNSLTPGESLQFWGAQLEQLPYATSYIPTNGVTVTRAQELCVDATPTINSEEGVLYVEASTLVSGGGENRYISLSDGSAGNIVQLLWFASNDNFRLAFNGTAEGFATKTIANIGQTNNNKIAIKYSSDGAFIFINGSQVGSIIGDFSFSPSTLTELDFSLGTNATPFYGRTKDLRIYTEALTDEQLTDLTTL